MNAPNLRGCAAVALLSISLTCLVFALPKAPIPKTKTQIAKIRSDCADDAEYYRNGCISNIPTTATGDTRQQYVDDCNQQAYREDIACLERNGVAAPITTGGAGGNALPKQGLPNPTPTPGKGPGGISTLPKSNPTATPRTGKGRGGISGLPKSNPTPTPSASGPTLLNKKHTPTPTPSGTPRKDHH